eukprot:700543-Pleurochrysis_carterae.AAC.2
MGGVTATLARLRAALVDALVQPEGARLCQGRAAARVVQRPARAGESPSVHFPCRLQDSSRAVKARWAQSWSLMNAQAAIFAARGCRRGPCPPLASPRTPLARRAQPRPTHWPFSSLSSPTSAVTSFLRQVPLSRSEIRQLRRNRDEVPAPSRMPRFDSAAAPSMRTLSPSPARNCRRAVVPCLNLGAYRTLKVAAVLPAPPPPQNLAPLLLFFTRPFLPKLASALPSRSPPPPRQ